MDISNCGAIDPSRSPTTLSEAIDLFDREVVSSKTPPTAVTYRRALKSFGRFMDGKKVSASDYRIWQIEFVRLIEGWYRHLEENNYARSTVDLFTDRVSSFFKWAVRRGHMFQNPIPYANKTKPAPAREIQTITPERFREILRMYEGTPYRIGLMLGYHAGLAMVDAFNLRWAEIDFEKMVITRIRHKNKRFGVDARCIVPIIAGSPLFHALNSLRKTTRKSEVYVSPTLAHTYQNCSSRKLWFANFKRKTGITFHVLRHTYLSRLVNSNMNLGMVCMISGHKDLATLKKYSHPDVEALKEEVTKALFPKAAPDAQPPPNVIQINEAAVGD